MTVELDFPARDCSVLFDNKPEFTDSVKMSTADHVKHMTVDPTDSSFIAPIQSGRSVPILSVIRPKAVADHGFSSHGEREFSPALLSAS
jgi:hypothetical protein